MPAYVKYFLRYLSRQVSQSRHCDCADVVHVIHMIHEGRPDPWRSRWYSLEITRAKWPWIFERGEKPAGVMSTIEALVVLMGLKLLHGDDARSAPARIQMITFIF